MTVVPSGNQFIGRDEENGPGANFVTGSIVIFHLWMHDFSGRWCCNTEQGNQPVAGNHDEFHPPWPVHEDSVKDVLDGKPWLTQYSSVGIPEIRCLHKIRRQYALSRVFTFFNNWSDGWHGRGLPYGLKILIFRNLH